MRGNLHKKAGTVYYNCKNAWGDQKGDRKPCHPKQYRADKVEPLILHALRQLAHHPEYFTLALRAYQHCKEMVRILDLAVLAESSDSNARVRLKVENIEHRAKEFEEEGYS